MPGRMRRDQPQSDYSRLNRVQLDPGYNGTTNKIVYAGAFGPQDVGGSGGVWRSTDGGVTWTQIKTALNTAATTDRPEFAVTPIAGGFTRMYVGVETSVRMQLGFTAPTTPPAQPFSPI